MGRSTRSSLGRPGGIALLSTCVLVIAGAVHADDRDPLTTTAEARPIAKVELSDAQLDHVTAGASTAEANEDIVTFAATKATASGKTVTAEGSFQVLNGINPEAIGNLILSDGAQGQLRSLININAVNSEVNVLLNLNITIDSAVGTLNQLNLNGVVPGVPTTRP